MLGLESIQSLIHKRKLQWVAHRARRGDKDLTWKRMAREVEDGKSKWGSRLNEDWKELGVNTVRGWCNKVKDKGWLASKLEGSKKKRERTRSSLCSTEAPSVQQKLLLFSRSSFCSTEAPSVQQELLRFRNRRRTTSSHPPRVLKKGATVLASSIANGD